MKGLEFLTEFSSITNELGFPIIIFGVGLTIILSFRNEEISNNFIISGFVMSIIGMVLMFGGLIQDFYVLIYFSIFILGIILKVVF